MGEVGRWELTLLGLCSRVWAPSSWESWRPEPAGDMLCSRAALPGPREEMGGACSGAGLWACDLVMALSGGTESVGSTFRFQLITIPPFLLSSPGGDASSCFMFLLAQLSDTPSVGWACPALTPTASCFFFAILSMLIIVNCSDLISSILRSTHLHLFTVLN